MAPEAFLFAGGGLVDVEGRTGEDRVVVAFFAEGLESPHAAALSREALR